MIVMEAVISIQAYATTTNHAQPIVSLHALCSSLDFSLILLLFPIALKSKKLSSFLIIFVASLSLTIQTIPSLLSLVLLVNNLNLFWFLYKPVAISLIFFLHM